MSVASLLAPVVSPESRRKALQQMYARIHAQELSKALAAVPAALNEESSHYGLTLIDTIDMSEHIWDELLAMLSPDEGAKLRERMRKFRQGQPTPGCVVTSPRRCDEVDARYIGYCPQRDDGCDCPPDYYN